MPPGKRYTGSGPMSDAEWKLHGDYVQRTLVAAGGDDTLHSPLSTHISEDMVKGVEGNYNDHRRTMQNQILNAYGELAQSVPNERRCIMTGGPMGAGKSTLLRKGASKQGSIAGDLGVKYASYDPATGDGIGPPTNFVILSADDISEQMATKRMIPTVDHLDPMETATFVHEEASHLSKRLATQMVTQGKNVIWDFSMSSERAIASRMRDLHEEGYHTAALFVDVSPSQSNAAAQRRARQGHDQWLAGIGPGGRTPPTSHVMASAMGTGGPYRSKNRVAFETMKGQFDQTITVDNENYAAKIIGETGHDGKGKEPHPVDVTSANGKTLKVGDQVAHRDGSEGMIGTVESLPVKGHPVEDRVGVYWITPGKGAIRDKHPAGHLIKVGGAIPVSREDRPVGRLGLPAGGPFDEGLAPRPLVLSPVGA